LGRYLLIRFFSSAVTVLAATFFVFGVSRTASDPLDLYIPESGYGITEEGRIAIGKELNLDRAVPVAYFLWLGKAVRGDLGKSLVNKRPVVSVIKEKILNTLQLGFVSWVLATVIGVPMGILSAVKRGTIWDYIGRGFALFGQAIPNFWFAIISILIFAVWLGWFPSASKQGLAPSYFVLPAVTLGSAAAAGYLRITRSAMLEILDTDYIKFAQVKGLQDRVVIWRHAARNALIPILTFGGIALAGLLNGSVIVEVVFAWPGIGLMLLEGILSNNFPQVEGAILVSGFAYIVTAMLVDILYGYADPRVRLT